MLDRLPTSPGLPPVRLPPDALTRMKSRQVADESDEGKTGSASDLRGTKPAPNGIDVPGQCT